MHKLEFSAVDSTNVALGLADSKNVFLRRSQKATENNLVKFKTYKSIINLQIVHYSAFYKL
jgi:hypothetical protein